LCGVEVEVEVEFEENMMRESRIFVWKTTG